MEKWPVRLVAGFVAMVALVGFGWIVSLPNKAECIVRRLLARRSRGAAPAA